MAATYAEWFRGLDFKNLGILACLLVTLWTCLGMIFWAKLNIAQVIRSRNYFAVTERWNGDYELYRGELQSNVVGGLVTQPHSTGYPDIPLGCDFLEYDDRFLAVDDTTGIVTCDDDDGDHTNHWAVPPWVIEQVAACQDINDNTSLYSPDCASSEG